MISISTGPGITKERLSCPKNTSNTAISESPTMIDLITPLPNDGCLISVPTFNLLKPLLKIHQQISP
ncbi:hypothetical protein, partial [Zooshikella ganghwensis]|uniref:hypothetical protein n=1 Tax=Zooshikella ganghwensis TaxID=202772 RepID=UPI00197D63F4